MMYILMHKQYCRCISLSVSVPVHEMYLKMNEWNDVAVGYFENVDELSLL